MSVDGHRRVVRLTVGAVLTGALIVEAVVLAPYVARGSHSLAHPHLGWLLVAIGAELVSMGSFVRLQRRMLAAGGTQVSYFRMTAITYTANALSKTLPAGAAISSGYTFRRMRASGASTPLATFALICTGILETIALALLGLFGLLFGSNGVGPLTIVGIAAIVGIALLGRRLSHRPEALRHFADRVLHVVNRVRRRRPDADEARLHDLIRELTDIKPSRRDWLLGLWFATLNWFADLVCLVAACRAVGANHATIGVVLVGYLAGMAASSLSLLPGGLGVVDAALILALVHGGVSPATATAGVLLYRLISFICFALLGWLIWAVTWHWRAIAQPSIPADPVAES